MFFLPCECFNDPPKETTGCDKCGRPRLSQEAIDSFMETEKGYREGKEGDQ